MKKVEKAKTYRIQGYVVKMVAPTKEELEAAGVKRIGELTIEDLDEIFSERQRKAQSGEDPELAKKWEQCLNRTFVYNTVAVLSFIAGIVFLLFGASGLFADWITPFLTEEYREKFKYIPLMGLVWFVPTSIALVYSVSKATEIEAEMGFTYKVISSPADTGDDGDTTIVYRSYP